MTSRLLRSLREKREETRPLFFDRLTRHQAQSLMSETVDHLKVEIDEMDEDAFVDT